ncbi:MAG TPA: hypothetical protein VFS25_22360 [Chitinophaga sp.]|uniref:hypothetical protein n=1 Tax=Chitinophaga sp. TaxID=1869181 RepID=UPI002DB9AC9D|nr:hypothetical protein [Chitinophaga sp.]HEU4555606.1 hypothetical protein [Chitinophaga sp.]
MRTLYLIITMAGLFNTFNANAQSVADDWKFVGNAQGAASPYDLYYYKLIQLNGASHRYASIIEVSVQADANYYNMQGTYQIRVDKYEGTTDRFDGIEIKCTSGNPGAGYFYIFNNAVWVRSNFKWGYIYYRTAVNFTSNSPLNTAPFNQTFTAPTGYATVTGSGSIKCDFDNNKYYPLPYTDVNGGINVSRDEPIGFALYDKLTYDSKPQPNYGFQWTMDSWSTAGASYWLAAYGGIKMFTKATPRLAITVDGNVGIGTTAPQAKLAVNGDVFAKKIKVTQTGWPDYVFSPDYKMRTLPELERYIKENQHLPEIPTAAAIQKDGHDLGEMNKKLLQKVEELTLYLIELKKENNEMKQRLEKLEKSK